MVLQLDRWPTSSAHLARTEATRGAKNAAQQRVLTTSQLGQARFDRVFVPSDADRSACWGAGTSSSPPFLQCGDARFETRKKRCSPTDPTCKKKPTPACGTEERTSVTSPTRAGSVAHLEPLGRVWAEVGARGGVLGRSTG